MRQKIGSFGGGLLWTKSGGDMRLLSHLLRWFAENGLCGHEGSQGSRLPVLTSLLEGSGWLEGVFC